MDYLRRPANVSTFTLDTDQTSDLEWSPGLDPGDLRDLREAEKHPEKIVLQMPKEAARLGYFSTVCLLFNRMIGTSTTP